MASGFQIEVSGDVIGVETLPKQLNFAAGKSLNDTGKFGQDEIIRELDDELILRGTWFKPGTRFGINLKRARFASPTPEAELFTRADWLLEEEGFNRGVKEPEGHEHIADPEDANTRGDIRRKFPVPQKAGRLLANAGGRVSLKTGKLIGKTGAFIVRPKDKPGLEYIFQRVGTFGKEKSVRKNKFGVILRGRVKGGNSKLVLKHILKKRVKVDRHFIFQKTAVNTYNVWYGTYFGRNLALALRTAKR